MDIKTSCGSSVSGASDQSLEHCAKLAHLRGLVANAQQRVARRHSNHPAHPDRDMDPAGEDHSHDWHLGVWEIDDAMACGGLSVGGVHELSGVVYGDAAAASGCALGLLRQLAKTASLAPILWCQTKRSQQEFGLIHGDGLKAFGLHADQLLFADACHSRDVLWALEEGARSRSLLAVVGEVDAVSFTQTRRLALAAAAGGTPVLLLRAHNDVSASAAETRWRIAAAPGTPDPFVASAPDNPRWQVELTRCRGGRSGSWVVEWNNETHRFSLAEQLPDRSSQVANAPIITPAFHILQRRIASA